MSSSSAGYDTVFVATLEALKEETLLKVTENGPLMIEVINFLIMSVSTCETRDFLVGLISKLEACLRAGDRCQLPSSKAARVWSSFHRLRVDPDHKVAWANFLSSIHLPVPHIPLSPCSLWLTGY